ncbi:cyclic GMP-AMP synthase-like receptor [Montipora capricornis]|uniref:cyclic GMP-AMP synthase-like receptor n=1 Tax=Montipora capricornis TaxID=246305 RepID=UPI0035F21880
MATPSPLDLFLADLDERKGKLPRCEEVSLIQRRVRKVIKTILLEVRRENPFYMTTLVNSGSFYEGTKVGKPDEFDFFIQLDAFSCSDDIEFYELPCSTVLVIPSEAACNNIKLSFPDDFARSMMDFFEWKKNIKTPFLKLFGSKARDFEAYGMKVVLPYEANEIQKQPPILQKHGPAYTLLLEWNGGECYKGLKISVDLALAVKINSQPKVDMQFESPSGRVIKSLLGGLPYFFAIGSYRNVLNEVQPDIFAETEQQSPGVRPFDFCLRCSQSWLEQVLFCQHFGPGSGQSKCLRLLKVLRDIFFPDDQNTDNFGKVLGMPWYFFIDERVHGVRKLVSSYILKTLVLFEWQKNPAEDLWSGSNLSQRLFSIIRDLVACLKGKYLTSFFYADYNLYDKTTPDIQFVNAASMVNTLLERLDSIKVLPEYSFEVCVEKIRHDLRIICRKKEFTSLLSLGLHFQFLDHPLLQTVVEKSLRNEGKGEIYDSAKTVENENGSSFEAALISFTEASERDDLLDMYIQCLMEEIAPEETLALTNVKAKNRESLSNTVKRFENIAREKMGKRGNLPSYDLWIQEHWKKVDDSSYKLTSDVPMELLKFIIASFREDIQILHADLVAGSDDHF